MFAAVPARDLPPPQVPDLHLPSTTQDIMFNIVKDCCKVTRVVLLITSSMITNSCFVYNNITLTRMLLFCFLNSEVKADLQVNRRRLYKAVANGKIVYPEEGVSVPMWGVHSDWSELQSSDSHGAWPVYDSDSQPSSLDSGFSLNQLLPLSTPLEGELGWRVPQCSQGAT